MARALTMRRARVAEAHIAAYVDAVERAARQRKDAGQHLWLFRHAADAGIFMEFREGPDAAALAPDAADAELGRFAEYSEGGAELWLEVHLGRERSADTP